MRCDKMTIAAFSTLLKLYENPPRAKNEIPTLRLLARKEKEIKEVAERLHPKVESKLSKIATVEIISCKSQVGSGAFPIEVLPSAGLKIIPKTKKKNSVAILNRISSALRGLPVPIIGRISDGTITLDLRCLENEPLFIKQFEYLNLKELTNE